MSALIRCPECQGKKWTEQEVETVENSTERVSYLCETCGSTGEVPRWLGTGRKMDRAERIRARADLDAHYSGLERTEG